MRPERDVSREILVHATLFYHSNRNSIPLRRALMTIFDESTRSHRGLKSFNTYQHGGRLEEHTPLIGGGVMGNGGRRRRLVQNHFTDWIPSQRDEENHLGRSWRRRLFLLITEPETSFLSATFYAILILAIFASNILMIIQTMAAWQFTPNDCRSCGGDVTYYFEDDDTLITMKAGVQCVCPPEPLPFTITSLNYLMTFFTVEWCMRALLFVPADPNPNIFRLWIQWFGYLTSTSMLVDALAIFPYYLENLPSGLVSLRLVRLFRIFQLVRLGQYNSMFMTLTNVLAKSLNYVRLLILILAFGGAFFGSLIYWVEKGTWKYYEASKSYQFLRVGLDGVTEEPSPFGSIPQAFWWFMVTATTVGYGDYYPTSTAGKWVASFAMLMGVLVIAFPVSVFSDLWSHELKQVKGFESHLLREDDDTSSLNEEADQESNIQHPPTREESGGDASVNHVPPTQPPIVSRLAHIETGAIHMDQQDLKELVGCVNNIQDNQRQLQSILRKYKLQ